MSDTIERAAEWRSPATQAAYFQATLAKIARGRRDNGLPLAGKEAQGLAREALNKMAVPWRRRPL